MSCSIRVKLICGLIFKDQQTANKAKEILKKHFGFIDFESPVMAFDYTDYYEPELGTGLSRQFISFTKLIPPENLAKIKNTTIKIEKRLSKVGRRRVNLDPGYLDLAKLILATTKDFSHRIYLGKGIFAETTMVYTNKTFTHYDWTYPDYRSDRYIEVFNKIREIYAGQIK